MNGFFSPEDILNIGLVTVTTSVNYMCDGEYIYTLDDNFVKCTDSGDYSNTIGKCVKRQFSILYIFVTKNLC